MKGYCSEELEKGQGSGSRRPDSFNSQARQKVRETGGKHPNVCEHQQKADGQERDPHLRPSISARILVFHHLRPPIPAVLRYEARVGEREEEHTRNSGKARHLPANGEPGTANAASEVAFVGRRHRDACAALSAVAE
jgi:hypothetical protein